MGKRGPTSDERILLQIWTGDEKDKEFQYGTLLEKRKLYPDLRNITERTFVRYLKLLVKARLLQKRVDQSRNTFYRIVKKAQKEGVRERYKSILKNLKVNFGTEKKGRSYACPLMHLDVIGLQFSKQDLPELSYSVLFDLGDKKFKKPSERFLKMKIDFIIERLVATILHFIVCSVYGKDPEFIEKVDELVDWHKDAINQKFLVNVVFDGKTVAENIDWTQVKQNALKVMKQQVQMDYAILAERTRLEEIFKRYPKQFELTEEKKQAKLTSLVDWAICSLPLRFKSKEEAIDAVVNKLNDEEFLSQHFVDPRIIPLLKEENSRKQIVEEYSRSPTSERVLKLMKYQYPRTNRVYDIYMFAWRIKTVKKAK